MQLVSAVTTLDWKESETAMLTTFNEVDMSAIFELRKKYKEKFKAKHGVNLGFMSFFTLASVRALQEEHLCFHQVMFQ